MEATLESLRDAVYRRASSFGWACNTLPENAHWLIVGRHRVLLRPLPENPADAYEVVKAGTEAAFDQWLVAGEAGVANITMFCIAPPGSTTLPEWGEVAAAVERDDAVCRKLVWLPATDLSGSEAFLDRSFLARPWDQARPQGPDELAILADSLAIRAAWMKRLLDPELEGADLVEALLAVASDETP